VECAARLIQVVFEPLDLFAQTVAFLAIPIPLASQLLVLALLPFEFFDELSRDARQLATTRPLCHESSASTRGN
jgi:hypothetical protein